jgi:hypothetical protein
MTASSSVVLSNLAYLIGAVVLAIIGGCAVWLHHRQPKSIDANVDAFQRGLQAIAPDSSRPGPLRGPALTPPEALRVRPRSAVTLQAAAPDAPEEEKEAEVASPDGKPDPAPVTGEHSPPPAGSGDGAGDRAGAETG